MNLKLKKLEIYQGAQTDCEQKLSSWPTVQVENN